MGHKEWVQQRAALGHLRRRFPGIDAKAGACVADMADILNGPEKVRTWWEVRAASDLPGAWHGWVHGRLLDGTTFKFPVVPDEHNPRPDKLVKVDDPPHVFTYMDEAEKAATAAADELKATLKKQLS